jgi:ribose-phosphate pyrophosphokinase
LKTLFVPFPGTTAAIARTLAKQCGGAVANLNYRRFPDGESYFRVEEAVAEHDVVLVCSLDDPDPKTTLLQLIAAELRVRGARSVGLVAPYLAYMRQDARFHPGEPVSARLYAGLISGAVDWLATVDPHLHRVRDLAEIYAIPTRVVHATEPMAAWVRREARDALLVGPDEESRQWVSAVAAAAEVPFVVLRKQRLGDREVRVGVGDLSAYAGRTPVLIDDVVSSGHTLIAAAAELAPQGLHASQCLAVHSLASTATLRELSAFGLTLVSSDSTVGPTRGFSVAEILAPQVSALLADAGATQKRG